MNRTTAPVLALFAVLFATCGQLARAVEPEAGKPAATAPQGADGTRKVAVSEESLPFKQEIALRKREAFVLTLPNDKDVALWATSPGYRTQNGLRLVYGEKPFKDLKLDEEAQRDGSLVVVGWKSYIRDGGITSWSNTPGQQRTLFVEKYCIVLLEDDEKNGAIPVKITVRAATEREQLYGRAERDHFMNALKSDDAGKRLEALKELWGMVAVGHHYGPGKEALAAAVRPLLKDPDENVKTEAGEIMINLGDEASLLALVMPEPQGKWRTNESAGRIASSAKGPPHREKVSKHVLTFFTREDAALYGFAVTYFSLINFPEAKPHMLAALKNPSPAVRERAVDSLATYCTDKERTSYLAAMLSDPSAKVLVMALREAGGCTDIPTDGILRHLRDNDEEVRAMAVYALSQCHDPKIVAPLLESTRDASPKVRGSGAVSLGMSQGAMLLRTDADPRVLGRLVEMLADDDAGVRRDSVNGLRWLRDRRAIPHLKALMEKEKEYNVKDMAKSTISELQQ